MRSKHFYRTQIAYSHVSNSKPSDGKKVIDDPQFIVDLIGQVRKLDGQVRQWSLEDGINWIVGLDSYIKDKTNTLYPRFLSKHIFTKGDIVLVDFFGHFGTELTYEHPAIVLVDNYQGLIIAPISSSSYNDGISTHVDLIKDLPGYGSVKKNSGIKMEQLRYISKSRVFKKFNRVSDNAKLKEIDEVLMNLLAKFTYDELLVEKQTLVDDTQLFVDEITKLSKEIDEKNKELFTKDEEIARLEERIEQLSRV